MKKLKKSAANTTMLTSCATGILVAFAIVCLLALISTICISNEYISMNAMEYFAPVAQFLGVLVGCLLAGKMSTERKTAACLITAAGLLFLQLCGALLFFDGISGSVLASIIVSVMGVLSAIYLGNRHKKAPAGTRRRKRYR